MDSLDRVDVHRRLFEDFYLVYIPYAATVSEEELREYGVVGFHDKASLDALIGEPILSKANIATLADFNYKGVEISFYNINDLKTIFNLITQHLENWLVIGKLVNPRRLPPLIDLLQFDKLAADIYQYIDFDKATQKTPVYNSLDVVLGNNLLRDLVSPSSYQNSTKNTGYDSYANKFIELGLTMDFGEIDEYQYR